MKRLSTKKYMYLCVAACVFGVCLAAVLPGIGSTSALEKAFGEIKSVKKYTDEQRVMGQTNE